MAQNAPEKLAKKIKNFIYHPADSIGSGFSSEVFKGVNELQTDPAHKNIAIKVIQLSKIKNEVENYLLNNQVNALKLLKHVNILQTVQVLMTKNNVYIITEFCEGGDILKHIKSNGPFPQAQALALIKDIIQGYKCIEEHRIIHRDLKTSNVFLSKGRAKIADFGFCEFVGEKKPQVAYNVGSPAYMSPEAYKQNIYSHKTDMWAIGIIFYELLVGDTPDRTQTYTQMTTNLMNGKINNIQNDSIRAMLILCFKKNPNQRIDATSLSELVTIQLNKQRSAEVQSMNVNQADKGNVMKANLQMSGNMSPASNNKDIKFFKAEIPSNPKIPNIPLNRGSQQNIFERGEQPPSRRSFSKQKIQPYNKGNSIKPHTDYLLFLYRLLKFVAELKTEKSFQILLPIFRHKNLIDSLVEQQVKRTKSQLQTSQGYKQFQYLKNRFQEVYVQHTRENSGLKNNFKDRLDSLANTFFLHPDAIQLYRTIFKDAANECVNILEGKQQTQLNKSQVGIVLDYLIIEHEILGLHLEGLSLPDVVSASSIDSIIKEKPKKLTATHLQVLKRKFHYFMGGLSQAIDNDQAYQIPNIANGFPHPQGPPSLPLNHLVQNPIIKESYSQRSHTGQSQTPTLINGIQNQQIYHMLMGQQVQVQNPSFGHPQQQNQGIFQQPGQYPTMMSQIPIHQSIVMNKWP